MSAIAWPGAAVSTVIVRLDRTIQYSEAPVLIREAAAYWIPRMRGV
jgi:hypothetical protein